MRRHSVSSATTLVRYVEWTLEDDASRKRGRLVLQSERNRDVNFVSRQHARAATSGLKRSTVERYDFAVRVLRDNFLFSHMAKPVLLQMIEAMEEMTIGAGETLFSVGDEEDVLYVLMEGEMVLAIPKPEAGPDRRQAAATAAAAAAVVAPRSDPPSSIASSTASPASVGLASSRASALPPPPAGSLSKPPPLMRPGARQLAATQAATPAPSSSSQRKTQSDTLERNVAVVTKLRCGATFGEMALLYSRRRTGTAVSASRSVVWALSRGAYLDLLLNLPSDSIGTLSLLKRLPIFGPKGAELFSALDAKIYRMSCAMQESTHEHNSVVLELQPSSNTLMLLRSGAVRIGQDILGKGTILAAGRPLDCALISLIAEAAGQDIKLISWGTETPRILAVNDEPVELLSMSLQEFMLLLGPSPALLAEKKAVRCVLRDVAALATLSDEQLEPLVVAATPCEFAAGMEVIREGDAGEAIYFLADGEVQISVGNTVVRTVGRGNVLGERSVIRSQPTSTTVTTLKRCVMLRIAGDDFLTAMSASLRSCLLAIRYMTDVTASQEVTAADLSFVISVLGHGAHGPVQLCATADGTPYVVKIMSRDAIKEGRQQDNVLTEMQLLSEVQHPFVVLLHGTFKTERYIGLIMEPLLGGDLFTHLTSRPEGIIPPDDACFYISCVLCAIGHLHSRHIIYRDLKPENVMLQQDGYVKLIDFGYAKRLAERTYSVVGTVEYLAPEVILQRGHRFGADWWALGVLLYEMICGCTPFTDCGSVVNEMEICKNITSDNYRFAFRPGTPPIARNAAELLLTRNPIERLGCGGGSVRDVMGHKFFKQMDFDALVSQALVPPFIPSIDSETDTSHFDQLPMGDAIDVATDAPYEQDPRAWDFFF